MAFPDANSLDPTLTGPGEARPGAIVLTAPSFEDGLVAGRFAKVDAGRLDNVDGSVSPLLAGVVRRGIANATEHGGLWKTALHTQVEYVRAGLCTVEVCAGHTPSLFGRVYVKGSGAEAGCASTTTTDLATSAEFLKEVGTNCWLVNLLPSPGDSDAPAAIPPVSPAVAGDLVKQTSTGLLEGAGVAATALQVKLGAGALDVAQVNATTGALERSGVLVAGVMRRPTTATAGDVATMDANKDAVGSGLQLSGVARRANPSVAGNLASLDSDGDPTNSGYAANLLTGALPVAGAAVTGTYAATIGGCFIEADSTAGDVTVTLPIGTAIPDGKVYHIKKIVAANNLIVVPEATEVAGSVRIDGATSQTTAIQWATLSVIRNGGQWRMI